MEPTIQLIQLMLRVERDTEAQRRPRMSSTDDLVAEKLVRPAKPDNRIKPVFNRQSCECL